VWHTEKVLRDSFVAHDDPPKVLEPRKESLYLSPPSVATQRATVLRPLLPGPPVRSDQLYATACKFRIQTVRLVGVVSDEALR
jgi:hypothetical protein